METLKKELIYSHKHNRKLEAIQTIGKYFEIRLIERKEICDLHWNTTDSEICADNIISTLKKEYKHKLIQEEKWSDVFDKSNATNIDGLKLFLEDYYNPPTKKIKYAK